MAISQIGSTTTAYQLSTTSVSSTTPSSSTTATSNTNASTTVGVTTSSTTVNYSSATASTTCSTTISYGGASTTASVSSTTSSTTAVSSTTATSSTTAIASTTPSRSTTAGVSGSIGVAGTASVSPYPHILHGGDEAISNVKKALFVLEYCDSEVDENWVEGLERFKRDQNLADCDTYGAEVVERLFEVYNQVSNFLSNYKGDGLEGAKNALSVLGFYDSNNNERWTDGLEKFKNSQGLSDYNTHGVEVADKLFKTYTDATSLLVNFESKNFATPKNALEFLGFCNSDNDRAWIEGLEEFKRSQGLSDYDTYGVEVATKLKQISNGAVAFLQYFREEGLDGIKKALFTLGTYDPESNESWIEGLETFKYSERLGDYDTFGAQVANRLLEVSSIMSDESKKYVSREKLKEIGYHRLTDAKVNNLNYVLYKYGITEKNQIDHFLAQCYVESYKGLCLREINWDTGYYNQDEEVNRIYFNEKYANAVGNKGGEDGYTYRGGGYLQLTGRENYTKFSEYLGDDKIKEGVEYVAENYAWESAGWYWKTFVQYLFEDEDAPTVKEVTSEINPALYKLDWRTEIYDDLKEMQ